MQKQVIFKTRGMQRDLSASAFNSEYSYENRNIRITAIDDNTSFSLTNEKGTKLITIDNSDRIIEGLPIGQAIIDEELIIFTTDSSNGEISKDRIYKVKLDNTFSSEKLYEGNLNFNASCPIESLSLYENESIKKVYWTDGRNQPRVINVAASQEIKNKWNDNSFDFTPTLKLQEDITITRNIVANGSFAPGVIQYAFTYFNKYGQESNIFYTSPLYYTSYNDRGASPEDKVSNSFDISISNIDNKFDYLRIYSIQRTSIDSTPICRVVADISVSDSNNINYVDNGIIGSTIDPTELLYIGGEEVIFGTMTQKDNTLFLGDISLKRASIPDNIKKYFKSKAVYFIANKQYETPIPKGYYPYENKLHLNSTYIKTFKFLEWYRFGVQFQHYTGKWSEPIWSGDYRNETSIKGDFWSGPPRGSIINLITAYSNLDNSEIRRELIKLGFIRVRPVIVYPSLTDRESICQGILCPTVYNVGDRYSNSPFVQSSWFSRPNSPFDIYRSFHSTKSGDADYHPLNQYGGTPSLISRAGSLTKGRATVKHTDLGGGVTTVQLDASQFGDWAEFRHNYPLPNNVERNAEIQCMYNVPLTPLVSKDDDSYKIGEWVNNNQQNFYVDQSILTFHSPDIEFDSGIRSIDHSNLKLRIVGMVPITSFYSDVDIQTSTPVLNFKGTSELPRGFYKERVAAYSSMLNNLPASVGDSKIGTQSNLGWRGLISAPLWYDEIYEPSYGDNKSRHTTGFVVYPWHRDGSLGNQNNPDSNNYTYSKLDKKRMSNLRVSYNSGYFNPNDIWKAYIEGNSYSTGISGVSIFDSNEVSMLKIKSPENSDLQDLAYYGNIDKLIAGNYTGDNKGYPIMIGGTLTDSDVNVHKLFSVPEYLKIGQTSINTATTPIRMKYKSTPHAVIALNYTKDNRQRVLPTFKDNSFYYDEPKLWVVNGVASTYDSRVVPFWIANTGSTIKGVHQDVINSIIGDVPDINSIQYGWFWLGELYNDTVTNRFGGQTEEAFENNQWVPCGEPVSLINDDGSEKDTVVIKWTEGDTYYQRYDHIKTYPFTLEDQNAMTDIVSFMCETRVNLDGRYDRNRGQLTNFAITPENFNKLNDVYSQSNNFFNYRAINTKKINLSKFPNSVTWTKTKNIGELIDTWTNITLASTLDLDGDKGRVRALRRLNNNIISFQDKGISQILYNESMQIASTEGVPIEIANSGKVSGKRYITDRIGCTNKWSICETPNGIYFIDDITKGVFLFNGQINNISDRFGFHSWINKVSADVSIWNPTDFNGFVTYYDKVNGDIFFINKEECLAFSEQLGQFSSFYNYENTPYFSNIKDVGIWIRDGKLWAHNQGDYNMFFGTYKPFSTTIIANPEMPLDKVFNTIEFRADSFDTNDSLLDTTFDYLKVWNEYQEGISILNNVPNKPSALKKKFRIWRANIPRDKSNNRDRMRNPWLYIKLSMEKENTNKTMLHDIIVHYFE